MFKLIAAIVFIVSLYVFIFEGIAPIGWIAAFLISLLVILFPSN